MASKCCEVLIQQVEAHKRPDGKVFFSVFDYFLVYNNSNNYNYDDDDENDDEIILKVSALINYKFVERVVKIINFWWHH